MSHLQSTSNKHPREDDVEVGSRAQAKKARSDETELVRDGEFWYEDGTIILVARTVQFRVYKGVLPTALAACCSLEVETLFDGFVREDGTRERLSEADLKLCLAGMRGLTLAVSAVVLKALASPSRRECKTKAACRREIQEILCDVAQEEDSFIYFLTDNPFRDMDGWIDVSSEEEKACVDCLAEVKKRFRTEQRNMWDTLPSILNIIVEGWPQSDECA